MLPATYMTLVIARLTGRQSPQAFHSRVPYLGETWLLETGPSNLGYIQLGAHSLKGCKSRRVASVGFGRAPIHLIVLGKRIIVSFPQSE